MKRAYSEIIASSFFKTQILADQIDNIGCLSNLLYCFLRNHAMTISI